WCTARHPAVELTTFVINTAAAATVAGTSRRASRSHSAVGSATSATAATTSAAAATTERGDDRRHIHAELFRLHLHVGVERGRRFRIEAALTAGNRRRIADLFGLGAELFELFDERGEHRVGRLVRILILLPNSDTQARETDVRVEVERH